MFQNTLKPCIRQQVGRRSLLEGDIIIRRKNPKNDKRYQLKTSSIPVYPLFHMSYETPVEFILDGFQCVFSQLKNIYLFRRINNEFRFSASARAFHFP